MEKKRRNFDENYAELVKFCEKEGKLPQPGLGKEGMRLKSFIQRNEDDPRVIKIKEKYSKFKSFDKNFKALIEFCEKEGRLPRSEFKKEIRLKSFIDRHKNDPRIIEIKEKYSRRNSFDENLQDLMEFCKKENRLPNGNKGREESRLSGFMKNYKKDPRIIEVREYYRRSFRGGKPKFDESLKDLIEFCEREGRLPRSGHGKEDNRLKSFINRYKDDCRVVEIREKYSRKGNSFNENLQDLVKFCEKEDRLPQSGFGKEEGRLRGFISSYKSNSKVMIIKKKYSKRGA